MVFNSYDKVQKKTKIEKLTIHKFFAYVKIKLK